jgi:hypothetical protein
VRGGDVEALATQVAHATDERSSREVLIRTRALIYADENGAAHIKVMSGSEATTKLTRNIKKADIQPAD